MRPKKKPFVFQEKIHSWRKTNTSHHLHGDTRLWQHHAVERIFLRGKKNPGNGKKNGAKYRTIFDKKMQSEVYFPAGQ